jgi:hypothetical protein
MDELTEGMDALSERRNIMNEKDFNDLIASVKEAGAILQNEKYKKEMGEIEQILGKALGYPWFKDDQCNFPNATEADGVAVGDHTAWSLAMEAADKIESLQKQLDESITMAEMLAATINQYKQLDDEQRATIKKLQKELDIHNARVHNLSLEEWRTYDQS